jgi:methylglutaconyl-CoA hydratase
MAYETLDIETSGPVATLWMNRPDRHNAFDETLIAELTGAVQSLALQPDIRVLVLAGRGQSFSAGADLAWMKRLGAASQAENVEDAAAMGRMFAALRHCPKPIVARVHGPAIGGGLGLVAACDIALAAEGAVFATPEVRLALIPAVIAPLVIAAIGERQCRRYFLTGERFSAAQALTLGLVQEVVPDAALDSRLAEMTEALLAGAPDAQAEAKALISEVAGRPLDAATTDLTARRIAGRRATAEAREGLSAFLARRRPAWAPASQR